MSKKSFSVYFNSLYSYSKGLLFSSILSRSLKLPLLSIISSRFLFSDQSWPMEIPLLVIWCSPLIGTYLYSCGKSRRTFSLHSSREVYISFQKGFMHFIFALVKESKLDFSGSKAFGNTSWQCSLNQVESDLIDLLNHDILKDFQKVLILGTPKPPCLTAICLVISSTTFGFLSVIKSLS